MRVTTNTKWAVAPTVAMIDAEGIVRIGQERQLACSDGVWHHSMAEPDNPDHRAVCEGEILLLGHGSFDGPALVYRLPGFAWTFLVPLGVEREEEAACGNP